MNKRFLFAFIAGAQFHARITTGAGMRLEDAQMVENRAKELYPDGIEPKPLCRYQSCLRLLASSQIDAAEFERRTGRKPF